jgi:nucleoside-diphosphate-sugar epimerase
VSHTTLVTGATGFIGQHLLRRLLEEDARVRVLCRRPEALPGEVRARVEVVAGDLRDARVVRRSVEGVQTVLHLGACARAWSSDPHEFRAVNLDAVAELLEAAEREGVQRLVHVSTVLTLGLEAKRGRALTPYEATKLEGERLVEASPRAVIVHPTRVYGPGPLNDANGVTKVIAAYLGGRFRVRLADGDVQANYVHVRDVADGIVLAARRGRPGAHYVLGGENTSLRGLLSIVARLSGVRRWVYPLPPRVAVVAAGAVELCGRVIGQVPITRDWVRLFLEDQRVDTSVTDAELGHTPRGLEEGVRETLEWLRGGARRAA